MAKQCMNCGKGVMYGHNVSHAKNRTRKIFQPNLHAARVQIGNHMKRVRLCTKCLRMFKEAHSVNSVQATKMGISEKVKTPAAV